MELYVLDSLFRRTAVIDSFESVVWTERFNDVGDCTLNIRSSLANRNLVPVGTMFAMNRSRRVMQVDTVEDKSNQDGSKVIVATMSSLEATLDDRPAWDNFVSGTTAEPKWVITGLPADLARLVFQTIMIDGTLDPNDVLPFYTPGNMYSADTISEPSTSVIVSLDHGSVLDALKLICSTYDLGFRLTRNADNSEIFFNVYAGNNRTAQQTAFPAVVFSPQLDNLLDSSYLNSQAQYKNMAYVWSPDGTSKVYDEGIDPTIAGFQRRTLLVNASDIPFRDRTIGPAYVVDVNQQKAVDAVKGLDSTTELQGDSLDKIAKLDRLLPQDLVNILAATNEVFVFQGTELLSIIAALTITTRTVVRQNTGDSAGSAAKIDYASLPADQLLALQHLRDSIRLDSADHSAINSLVTDNKQVTAQEKIDIPAAVNRQDVTALSTEVTLIQAAVAQSSAYNPTEDANLETDLQARGLQELQKYNNITAFDGEIPQTGSYKYDFDYYLGDIVEVRNEDGIVNDVRVTEQIFSQDAAGEKSYPTLSSRLVITAGVWASWDSNQEWGEVPDATHWADLS